MKEDTELLLMVADHYRRLWQVIEDLETLLWSVKELNDDMGRVEEAEN
jgi:hypothetical protein